MNNGVESDRALYLCAIYVPPLHSPYYNEVAFDYYYILHFQAQGSVLCGDFTARTGREPDCMCSEGDNHVFGGNVLNTELPYVRSFDNTYNKSGSANVQKSRLVYCIVSFCV